MSPFHTPDSYANLSPGPIMSSCWIFSLYIYSNHLVLIDAVANICFMTKSFSHCFLFTVGDIPPGSYKCLYDVQSKGDAIKLLWWSYVISNHPRNVIPVTLTHIEAIKHALSLKVTSLVLLSLNQWTMCISWAQLDGKHILTLKYHHHIKSSFPFRFLNLFLCKFMVPFPDCNLLRLQAWTITSVPELRSRTLQMTIKLLRGSLV